MFRDSPKSRLSAFKNVNSSVLEIVFYEIPGFREAEMRFPQEELIKV